MRSEYLPPADDAVTPRITRARVLRTKGGRVLTLRPAGRYRVLIRATDDAGNDSSRRLVRFRIGG